MPDDSRDPRPRRCRSSAAIEAGEKAGMSVELPEEEGPRREVLLGGKDPPKLRSTERSAVDGGIADGAQRSGGNREQGPRRWRERRPVRWALPSWAGRPRWSFRGTWKACGKAGSCGARRGLAGDGDHRAEKSDRRRARWRRRRARKPADEAGAASTPIEAVTRSRGPSARAREDARVIGRTGAEREAPRVGIDHIDFEGDTRPPRAGPPHGLGCRATRRVASRHRHRKSMGPPPTGGARSVKHAKDVCGCP